MTLSTVIESYRNQFIPTWIDLIDEGVHEALRFIAFEEDIEVDAVAELSENYGNYCRRLLCREKFIKDCIGHSYSSILENISRTIEWYVYAMQSRIYVEGNNEDNKSFNSLDYGSVYDDLYDKHKTWEKNLDLLWQPDEYSLIDRIAKGMTSAFLTKIADYRINIVNNNIIVPVNTIDLNLYKLLMNNPELLKTLDWEIFELLLGDILKEHGYKVEMTTRTIKGGDGGVDIIAIQSDPFFGGQKYLLQAKRYEKKSITLEPVERLLFSLRDKYKGTKACFATTSRFQSGVWELANQYRWQLELKDFNELHKWVASAYAKKVKL